MAQKRKSRKNNGKKIKQKTKIISKDKLIPKSKAAQNIEKQEIGNLDAINAARQSKEAHEAPKIPRISKAATPGEKSEPPEINAGFKFLKKKSPPEKETSPKSGDPEIESQVQQLQKSLEDLIKAAQNETVRFKITFKPQLPSDFLYLEKHQEISRSLISSYQQASRRLNNLQSTSLQQSFEEMQRNRERLNLLNILLGDFEEESPRLQNTRTAALSLFNCGQREKSALQSALQKALAEEAKYVQEMQQATDREFSQLNEKDENVIRIYNTMMKTLQDYQQSAKILEDFNQNLGKNSLYQGLVGIKDAENRINRLLSGEENGKPYSEAFI